MSLLSSLDVSSFCVGFAVGMLILYAAAPAPRLLARRPARPPMSDHC